MKYINADKLIAEIERLKARAEAERVLHPKTILSAKNYLLIKDYDALLDIITSLQQEQPEVDLEKEMLRYQREDMDRDTTVRDVAHHFFELGLNARKEDEKGILAEVMQLAGFKPPFLDGNQYCTLFGIDLMRSFVGFGNTETESFVEALKDVKNFIEK